MNLAARLAVVGMAVGLAGLLVALLARVRAALAEEERRWADLRRETLLPDDADA